MADASATPCATGRGTAPAPLFLFAPYRLPSKRYPAAFEEGAQSQACASLVVRYVPNGLDKTCAGVVSPKKVFRLAVERSRARRLLREAFRLERPRMRAGFDLVLIGRRKLCAMPCAAVRRDLVALCRRAGLLAEGGGRG